MPRQLPADEMRERKRAKDREWKRLHYTEQREMLLAKKRAYNKTEMGIAARKAWLEANKNRRQISVWANHSARKGSPADGEAIDYAAELLRDPCSYCGDRSGRMVIDHIVSVKDGGMTEVNNLTASCLHCNQRKKDHSLLRFLSYRHLPTTRARGR